MKKISLLIALFSFIFSCSFAQGIDRKQPVITLKGLPGPVMKGGKAQPINTTSDYILKNPSLVADAPNVVVVEFTAGVGLGDKYWGPFEVKGATLTQQVLDVIAKTKGPDVKVFFENIKVRDNGFVRTNAPVILKYDQ